MKLSVVVPVLNEEKTAADCLGRLETLRRANPFEVIFADGGSADRTAAVIGARAKMILAPRGRGAQLNAGARAASGDVLLFLHCDSRLPEDFFAQIEEVLGAGFRAGCFRLAFDSPSPLLKLCAFLSDVRVRTRQIVFGDQGLFIETGLFCELGGFPEIALMEDYAFSEKLRRETAVGMARGAVVTSARRFEKHGALRTLLRMQLLQRRYRRGDDPDVLLKEYERP